jgi:hypothetical protein
MGDSDAGSGRLTPAGSRHRAASGPGIRVIELHILGIQVQLLSINMGRRSWRSPANARHSRVDRTITLERRQSFVNGCGRGDLINQRKPLLSEVLEWLRSAMRR